MCQKNNYANTQLPVETISYWLNRERQTMDQSQQERRLKLSCIAHYSNIQEMCDFLKQVSFPFPNIWPQIICNLVENVFFVVFIFRNLEIYHRQIARSSIRTSY